MKKSVFISAMLAAMFLLASDGPRGNAKMANSPRPIASEYNAIRSRAKELTGQLHSQNAAEAAKAQQEWAAMLHDLEVWANKYHVHLATRRVSAGSGTTVSTHLPPANCKDLSNLGPDGSAAGDNSAGHCYLVKRTNNPASRYLCEYMCVPAEVIQQPDIEDSPYPSHNK
jgi:hypothetical protein